MPIPLSAVAMWADMNGLAREQTRRLDQIVVMLDDAYLRWYRDPATIAWRKSQRGG